MELVLDVFVCDQVYADREYAPDRVLRSSLFSPPALYGPQQAALEDELQLVYQSITR